MELVVEKMSLRRQIGSKIPYIISSYAPQFGLSESEKDNLFSNLLSSTSVVPSEGILLVCSGQNGHVRKISSGFEGTLTGYGFGIRNSEGTRVLELCAAADLVITNTYFIKCDSHLLSYHSGNACSQID